MTPNHRKGGSDRGIVVGVERRRCIASRVQQSAQQVGGHIRSTGSQWPDLVEDSHRDPLLIRVIQGSDRDPGTLLGDMRRAPGIDSNRVIHHSGTVAREVDRWTRGSR